MNEIKENKKKKKKEFEIIDIINNSETFLNKNIYLFLVLLFKNIFLKKSNQKDIYDKLDKIISHININMIKEVDKLISKEYDLKNIRNILDFAKSQNLIYCGDIIENILIYIFSFGFKIDKNATFGEYLYNNISKLRNSSNILNMIMPDIFGPDELQDLNPLIKVKSDDEVNEAKEKSVLYKLLLEIYEMKYKFIWIENDNSKALNYINNGYLNMKIYEKIYNILRENSNSVIEQDLTINSINILVSNYRKHGKVLRPPIRIVRAFLISVFIYYQNKHSPLMDYIKPNKNINDEENEDSLGYIPFTYELDNALIEGRFANIILSPLKIEPRINNVVIARNNLRESGLYELSKLLIMNKNIKLVDFKTSILRSNFLDYFNYGMGFHDNYTLEELDLSNNYFKEDSEENLYKIISHLKGLKTLNLSSNELRKGLSLFFVVLKKLYRKRKTKLENLYLNRCILDEQSLYELGELLKGKFCKLKRLSLCGNSFPYNNNDFLKKLKKNKSLTEIYLNRNDIWNGDIDDILRIINNTGIKYLYLYKIRITDFNKLLNILYRTKLIGNKNDKNNINLDELFLTNLDLSNNDFSIKNQHHIELLTKLVEKTNLNCLDISHILYDSNPDKYKKMRENVNYRKKVEALRKILEDNRNKYIKNVEDLRKNKVDKKNNDNLKDEKILKYYDDKINNIIVNDRAKYTLFLRKEAQKLLNNEKSEEIRKNEEELKKVEENIINYMIYKRAERDVNKLEKEIKMKKLIII